MKININPTTVLRTANGNFVVAHYSLGGQEGVSLTMGDITKGTPLLRLHSSCLFGESLGVIDCDCKLQLDRSLELIGKEGAGTLLYLYQEGRGIGLADKVRALEIMRQQQCDTAAAFEQLGFPLDPRDYSMALKMLDDLKMSENVRLISNNPQKFNALKGAGYNVIEQVTPSYEVNPLVFDYLKMKEAKLHHNISWEAIKLQPSEQTAQD